VADVFLCVDAALTHPEKAAKLKLLLFKPFTQISDLRPDGLTWQQSLAAFELSTTARVRRLLQHIDQICRHEQAGIEHRKQRLDELRAGRMPSDDHEAFHQLGMHRGDELDGGDEHADIDAPDFGEDESARKAYSTTFRDDLELNLSNGKHSDAGLHIQNTVQAASDARVFDSLQSKVALSRTPHRRGRLPAGIYRGIEADQLSGIQQRVAAEVRASKAKRAPSSQPDPKNPDEVMQTLPQNVQGCLPDAWRVELPVHPTPSTIADGFKLTRKQRLAFFIVADRFGKEMARDETIRGQQRDLIMRNWIPGFRRSNEESTDAIRLYLAGPAGTGKSHVIAAIVFLFTMWGKRDWLLLTATTGTASVSINGATVHSALGLSLYGSTEDDDKGSSDNKSKTDMANRTVKFIVLDEVWPRDWQWLAGAWYLCLRCLLRVGRCRWRRVRWWAHLAGGYSVFTAVRNCPSGGST